MVPLGAVQLVFDVDKVIETEFGSFVISLDYEIHWGVSDRRSVEAYKTNLKAVPQVVDRLLELFGTYHVKASWAVVGMLMCKDKEEWIKIKNAINIPQYKNPSYSNYRLASILGKNQSDDQYHFALKDVIKISNASGQDLGTHTYAHLFCLEEGLVVNDLNADLKVARQLFKDYKIDADFIVFPRNQFNPEFLDICRENGIKAFRGNENSWLYNSRSRTEETFVRRAFRLADSYLPLTGTNISFPKIENGLINIPSSRFLRPFAPKLSFLDNWKFKRIANEMEQAAKERKIFHLWWHPHNFGKYLDENLLFLERILKHFKHLNIKHGYQSMGISDFINQQNKKSH